MYFEPWNENVGVFGKTSGEPWVVTSAEFVICRFVNVPKRENAFTIAQRSVAQYGQYSAPM